MDKLKFEIDRIFRNGGEYLFLLLIVWFNSDSMGGSVAHISKTDFSPNKSAFRDSSSSTNYLWYSIGYVQKRIHETGEKVYAYVVFTSLFDLIKIPNFIYGSHMHARRLIIINELINIIGHNCRVREAL